MNYASFPKGYGRDSTRFETADIVTSSEAMAKFVVKDAKLAVSGWCVNSRRGSEGIRLRRTEMRPEVWIST